jgi:hypothetical protein
LCRGSEGAPLKYVQTVRLQRQLAIFLHIDSCGPAGQYSAPGVKGPVPAPFGI